MDANAGEATPLVGDVQRLSVAPDDVVVLTLPAGPVSEEQLEHLRGLLQAVFPQNKVLVLSAPARVTTIAREDRMASIDDRLAQMQATLDALVDALIEEEDPEDEPARTLDGDPCGAERDQSQGLS